MVLLLYISEYIKFSGRRMSVNLTIKTMCFKEGGIAVLCDNSFKKRVTLNNVLMDESLFKMAKNY